MKTTAMKIITVQYTKSDTWGAVIRKDKQVCRIEGLETKRDAQRSVRETLVFMRNSHKIKILPDKHLTIDP